MPGYFNRELSWIEFNARVLNEACKKSLPLLERLNFLAIVSSNFDEFFQVRVASIKRSERQNPMLQDASGYTPSALLKQISWRCHQIQKIQQDTLNNDLLPSLAQKGLCYVSASNFTAAQKNFAERLFKHEVFPVLTPLRTDGKDFPLIASQRVYAAFILEPMPGIHLNDNPFSARHGSKDIMAVVQIPALLPRLIFFPSGEGGAESATVQRFTTIDDIISMCGSELFPGYKTTESMIFRVNRDADVSVDEDSVSTSTFIQSMENVLVRRQSSFAVRLVCTSSSQRLLTLVRQKLALSDEDIYTVENIVDPGPLTGLSKIEGVQDLCYPEWKNFYPDDLPEDGTFWNTLRQHDVLLNVPYQSYEPVVKFLQDASSDPDVVAIKITLYRTGEDSPVIHALEKAARSGKQVTAFVELKARFDEQRNISWAAELEKSGVIVVYGVVNLKVHAKICMVVRREGDRLRRYVHFSTGNYNPKTALFYQDFSIFTSNPSLGFDATLFFNVISGYSALQTMHHLYMAPVTLKARLLELIDREVKQSSKDFPGLIMAKMNSLCHPEIIDALYRASQAGVRIMLNVRGICTLIPGVRGKSDNISVISVIDRYLEHSRVFYFQNAGEEELYLSSADWMERNLERRIELMYPVTDPHVFKTLKENLELYFQDNMQSHELQSDGLWKARKPGKKEEHVRIQEVLYKKYKSRSEIRRSAPKLEFIVRRKEPEA